MRAVAACRPGAWRVPISWGPEDSGLFARSEAQKVGKNTSRPRRAGEQTA